MGSKNRFDGVDQFAAFLIRKKARQLIGRAGLLPDDLEDVEQELILDVLRRLPSLNVTIATRDTFIARLVENHVATLLKARHAQKRSAGRQVPFDEGTGEDDEPHTFDQRDYLRLTMADEEQALKQRELALDVQRVSTKLPLKQRWLVGQLQTKTLTQIADESGIPRSSLYETRAKLAEWFEREGLRDYLRDDADDS